MKVISCFHHFLSCAYTYLQQLIHSLYNQTDVPVRTRIAMSCTTLFQLGDFLKITHTFLVRGHSFPPNDRNFGCSEMKKRRHKRIYTCDQWMEVIRKARVRKPFEVVLCERTSLLLYTIIWRKLLFVRRPRTLRNSLFSCKNLRISQIPF